MAQMLLPHLIHNSYTAPLMIEYAVALVVFVIILFVRVICSIGSVLFIETHPSGAHPTQHTDEAIKITGSADIAQPEPPVTGGASRAFTPLQLKIAKQYSKYARNTSGNDSFRKFCYPTEYKIQPHQAFLGEFMDPANGTQELLAYHAIGAGKSCVAIQVGKRYKRPLILLPASLIPGFRNELRSPCAGDKYITQAEREELKSLTPRDKRYSQIISESNARIDSDYTILSYNKFIEMMNDKTMTTRHDIIIVDEVHNASNKDGVLFNALLEWIEGHPKSSVLIMTATPIFDSATELVSLARLLRIDAQSLDTPADVERAFAGHVSYFAGAPSHTYPSADIRIAKVKMSSHQARWYASDTAAEIAKSGDIVLSSASNNFYANSRQRANVAFPRGLTGDDGLRALTASMIRDKIGVYSCKMAYMKQKLRKAKLTFIYSSYTGAGGIDLITKCLRAWGWKDYFEAGPGKARYAIWSGDTSSARKDEIRAVFNSSANDDASMITAVIGSPSIKEGVSLLRVRHAHIFDLAWNNPARSQIIGRVIRFCSHKSLPSDERNVKVWLYVSHIGAHAKPDPAISIDAYMLNIADTKDEENNPYLRALIRTAIDVNLL